MVLLHSVSIEYLAFLFELDTWGGFSKVDRIVFPLYIEMDG